MKTLEEILLSEEGNVLTEEMIKFIVKRVSLLISSFPHTLSQDPEEHQRL